jgi:hypothetical protein
MLAEVEALATEVTNLWPVKAGDALQDHEHSHPELWRLARLRDRTSDSVRIFAAMAVEGYLNWYGVFRLGESVFNQHFERLGLVPKLRLLLLVCDRIQVNEADPVVRALSALAETRNALVHPKAREVISDPMKHTRTGTKIPEVAREAVANMDRFCSEFVVIVPDAKAYIPK